MDALTMNESNKYRYSKAEYKQKIHSTQYTYRCCKFGCEYAFKPRDKSITIWRSVQNMETFDVNIITILQEQKVQTIKFTVLLCECMCLCVCVCVCICTYMHIHTCLFKMIVGELLYRRTYTPNSGNTHKLTNQFESGVHTFKRLDACVFRNRH